MLTPGKNIEQAKPTKLGSLNRGGSKPSGPFALPKPWNPLDGLPSRAPSAPAAPQPAPGFLDELLTHQPEPFKPSSVSDAQSKLLEVQDTEQPDRGRTGSRAGYGPMGRGNEAEVAAAQATLDEALRGQRLAAIGSDAAVTDKPVNIRKATDRLSWDEYNALEPRQRAAVDFNTMLVQAVRKDRNHADEYQPTDVERLTYDNAVEKMFGKDRGSDTYAPETVAVLRQIGFADDRAGLDDFLGLKAAIQASDLKNLDPADLHVGASATAVEGGDPIASERITLAQNLATSTAKMQKALARGNALLGAPSVFAAAAAERGDDTDFLGGQRFDPASAKTELGYGTDEVSKYFQQAFDILSRPENSGDKDQILATLNSELSPSELHAFMSYADQRSAMSQRYKTPLGGDQKAKYKTPEQFRKMLGLDQEGTP